MGRPEKKEVFKGMNNRMKAVYTNKCIDAYEEWIAECLESEEVREKLSEIIFSNDHSIGLDEILAFLKEKMIGGSKP